MRTELEKLIDRIMYGEEGKNDKNKQESDSQVQKD